MGMASGLLVRLWRGWKGIAYKVGNFQARVFFSFFYLVLLLPVALGFKALADPFRVKRRRDSFWLPHKESPPTMEEARRQY